MLILPPCRGDLLTLPPLPAEVLTWPILLVVVPIQSSRSGDFSTLPVRCCCHVASRSLAYCWVMILQQQPEDAVLGSPLSGNPLPVAAVPGGFLPVPGDAVPGVSLSGGSLSAGDAVDYSQVAS